MTEKEHYSDTEERIFEAALTVFAQKGKDGARMQEIADVAGINKAMLHYYFRIKDQLYEKVFGYVMRRFLSSFTETIQEAESFEAMLRMFINDYIDFIRGHQRVMRLMVNEMLAGGEAISRHVEIFFKSEDAPPQLFIRRIQAAIDSGEIRPVDPAQTLLTVVSGCIFFFIATPMVRILAPAASADEDAFIEQRKAHLFDLIYHGLQPRATTEG